MKRRRHPFITYFRFCAIWFGLVLGIFAGAAGNWRGVIAALVVAYVSAFFDSMWEVL